MQLNLVPLNLFDVHHQSLTTKSVDCFEILDHSTTQIIESL
jgi:hypothetical protein